MADAGAQLSAHATKMKPTNSCMLAIPMQGVSKLSNLYLVFHPAIRKIVGWINKIQTIYGNYHFKQYEGVN